MTAAAEVDSSPTGPDWLAGRSLLEHHARSGRVFTLNDGTLRADLAELGFRNPYTGRLLQMAEADGVIRKVGVRPSNGRSAHGAYVREWVGCQARGLDVLIPRGETVAVPVQRDRDGRFTAQPAFTDVPLFEVGAE